MRMPSLHHKAEPPPENDAPVCQQNLSSPWHINNNSLLLLYCCWGGDTSKGKGHARCVCLYALGHTLFLCLAKHWCSEQKACGGPAQFGSTLLHNLALGGTFAAQLQQAARDKHHKPWPMTTLQSVTGNTPTETHTALPFMACSVRLLHAIHQPNGHVSLCMQCSAVLRAQTNTVHPASLPTEKKPVVYILHAPAACTAGQRGIHSGSCGSKYNFPREWHNSNRHTHLPQTWLCRHPAQWLLGPEIELGFGARVPCGTDMRPRKRKKTTGSSSRLSAAVCQLRWPHQEVHAAAPAEAAKSRHRS